MEHPQGTYEAGVYRADNVRLLDLAGNKALPVGVDVFRTVVKNYIFVDKSMLIADVLESPGATTLYCRPRRFGKSLNLSMMQAFFEAPVEGDPFLADTTELFSGLSIWDAEEGRYRAHHGAYPVVRFSFNDVKDLKWQTAQETIRVKMAFECSRHGYLAESPRLTDEDKAAFKAIAGQKTSEGELKRSLSTLANLLHKHHEAPVVVLVDEYDAPVMAGYTNGYYNDVVDFLKGWLTGMLKSNEVLAFAVLTGVQRISKESIFSDLNNLTVNTSLSLASDERYGFTQAEIEAIAAYRGQEDGVEDARAWYDGYRFGSVDVYNPWSALNYFKNDCAPDLYWANTSGNGVLGDMVCTSSDRTMADLYRLMEPGGFVEKTLDLSVVFPDVGIRPDTLWSMLYLAGYVTTEDVELPNSTLKTRRLHIPNEEIRELFRAEVIQRFSQDAGGRDRLVDLHAALQDGDAAIVEDELSSILLSNASYHDLTREAPYHTLLLGLLFGMRGYADPMSNREAGRGRFDVRVEPVKPDRAPLLTIEAKWAAPESPESTGLPSLAQQALSQIDERAYESGAAHGDAGTMRWGIAFSGKNVACACERA